MFATIALNCGENKAALKFFHRVRFELTNSPIDRAHPIKRAPVDLLKPIARQEKPGRAYHTGRELGSYAIYQALPYPIR